MCSADDCAPPMVVGRGLMCSGDFVGLSSWVWVCEFGFMGLGLWIIDVTGVDRQVDQCGSLT